MANMYLVCGLPGSGKTTFAKELADRNNYQYFSPDFYYAYINGSELDRSNKFDAWIMMFCDIQEAMENNEDCVVDTAAITYAQRQEFLNWFPDFEHHLIWIDADIFQCLKNNESRKRVIPLERMEKYFDDFEEPDEEEDERWLTFTHIENVCNEMQLSGIYVKVGN